MAVASINTDDGSNVSFADITRRSRLAGLGISKLYFKEIINNTVGINFFCMDKHKGRDMSELTDQELIGFADHITDIIRDRTEQNQSQISYPIAESSRPQPSRPEQYVPRSQAPGPSQYVPRSSRPSQYTARRPPPSSST
jgi:hypothetical protein